MKHTMTEFCRKCQKLQEVVAVYCNHAGDNIQTKLMKCGHMRSVAIKPHSEPATQTPFAQLRSLLDKEKVI